MGSEIAPKPGSHPEIYVKVIGRDILHKVEIVKGYIGALLPFPTVHEVNPGIKACEFTWSDPAALSDCFYYIRVTQADEEMAWCGPIWVSPSMRIEEISRNQLNGNMTLSWGCLPFRLYSVYFRDSIDAEWQLAQTDIPSEGSGTIQWIDDGTHTGVPPSNVQKRFYTVKADG